MLIFAFVGSPANGMDCPSIPMPLAEAVMEAHGCMTKMNRPVTPEEFDTVQNFLMQCAERQQPGTSNPLVFFMVACSDAKYLDGTAYCMFDQEEAIFSHLILLSVTLAVFRRAALQLNSNRWNKWIAVTTEYSTHHGIT
ncbi:uncharacterized protein LOC144120312 [Amblyomma americanum]